MAGGAGVGAPLTAILGQLDPVLTAISLPSRGDDLLGEVVIWDPLDRLTGAQHGILLLVGVSPSHPLAEEIIEQAGRLEYKAVVMKCRDANVAAARAAAERAGVALLAAQDSVAWASVEALLIAAISAAGVHATGRFEDPITGDLFALANGIADLIGAAITIEDVNRQVLAYSNISGHAIDSSRQVSILGRLVPDLPEHIDEYREVAQATTAVMFDAYADTMARVVMPVRAGARLLGSIWAIDIDGKQGDRIAAQLAETSSQVALHLLRIASQQDLERHRRSEMLIEALDDRHPAQSGAKVLAPHDLPAALIGFRPSVDPEETVDQHRLVKLISLSAEATSRRAWCADADGSVFVLVPRSDRLSAAGVAQLAASTMKSVGKSFGVQIRCAYASEVGAREQLPQVRADIDRALRCADGHPIDVVGERYRVTLQALLESGIGSSSQLIPQVAAILAHDEKNRTEYARTLLTHLECSGDVRRAAELLSMHENSHRYRMRKILSEFDIDLDISELRIIAWLQLRAALSTTAT